MINRDIKKRMMFVKGEDCYYVSYNTFILLKELGCSTKPMKDYRKLAFLIEFAADGKLVRLIQRQTVFTKVNQVDRVLLTRAYSNGLLRSQQIFRILYSLEKRGQLTLEKNGALINVRLNEKAFPQDFFNQDYFQQEINNIAQLKLVVRGISTINFSTLIGKLFSHYGVNQWAAY